MTYTVGKVRFTLQNYQTLVQGDRIQPHEARLGSRPPPLDDAPWAFSSCLLADMDRGLKSLPADRMFLVFMELCLGGSSWRNGMKTYNWREKVGDWWRIKEEYRGLTAGDVSRMVDESLQEMVDNLNGTAVDNAPLTGVTVSG